MDRETAEYLNQILPLELIQKIDAEIKQAEERDFIELVHKIVAKLLSEEIE